MTPLEQEITELWGHITAAKHQFLTLVAEFDDTEGWGGAGITSCAHWLNLYCGIGIVAAREQVRVAHAIRALPKIDAAFREGQVSYSKVRAMTRVATPDNEDILLNIAIHGTAAHVEQTVRHFRRVERIEAASQAAEAQRDRYLQIQDDDDGYVVIHARLPAEVGALIRTAIERAMDVLESESEPEAEADAEPEPGAGAEPETRPVPPSRPDDSAESSSRVRTVVPEDHDTVGARRADALRLIAGHFLAARAGRSTGTSDRYQVVVHIDQRRLSDPADPGSDLCEIEDGPTLAAETARRLGCDGALVGIVDGEDGQPLDVGRKTRAIPPALRRALKARDKGCRFPGCTHTRFTEGHHIEHWANGGETKLSNLVTLCHFHHHLVHEGGFGLERTDDGVFIFSAPDGKRLPKCIPIERRFRGSALAGINADRGIAIAPDTVVTHWQGERMDYSLAIDALLRAREPSSSGKGFR